MNALPDEIETAARTLDVFATDAATYDADITEARKRLYRHFGRAKVDGLLTVQSGRRTTDLLHLGGLDAHANELTGLAESLHDIARRARDDDDANS